VQVSGFSTLSLKDGVDSHGSLTTAHAIAGRLEENGIDVTSRATLN
jgi:hypothetical protein